MLEATGAPAFAPPDVTTFCRLDGLGLVVTGQRIEAERAVLACRIAGSCAGDDVWCDRCGGQACIRDSVTRRLAHEPFGWRPTTLEVTLRRYACADCAHVWRQDMTAAAEARPGRAGQLRDHPPGAGRRGRLCARDGHPRDLRPQG